MIGRRELLQRGAAVTAIAIVGLPMGAAMGASSPLERIKYHARELEQAMRACYGVEVETLSYSLIPAGEVTGDMKPCIFFVAHTRLS